MSELDFSQKVTLLCVFVLGTVLAVGSWMNKKVEAQAKAIESSRLEIEQKHQALQNQFQDSAQSTAQSILETKAQITAGHLDLLAEHDRRMEAFEEDFMSFFKRPNTKKE